MLIMAAQEKLLQLCGVDVPHGMLIRCTNPKCQWKGIMDSLFNGRRCEHCEKQSLVEEREFLLSNISPIKVAGLATWAASNAAQALISHNIPRTPYLCIYRTEVITVNWTSGAADFGLTEPTPPGTAYWQRGPYGASAAGTNTEAITDTTAYTWATCDTDELLYVAGAQNVQLVVTFDAGPTGEERTVRGLMYGFYLGSAVIESLAANPSVVLTVP